MVIHLEEISNNIPKDRDGVVVLDGAAWHKVKKIQGFNNLSVLVLPPASPELNRVEQIWQQLRDNWLANRCYDGYEAILDACCHAWEILSNVVSQAHSHFNILGNFFLYFFAIFEFYPLNNFTYQFMPS